MDVDVVELEVYLSQNTDFSISAGLNAQLSVPVLSMKSDGKGQFDVIAFYFVTRFCVWFCCMAGIK